MMGSRQEAQAALFYEFSREDYVPQDRLRRSIDRFVDLSSIRAHLAHFYSHTGRPSFDPELLIRMLLVGYCFGIRSERRLCEEVHLNLAYSDNYLIDTDHGIIVAVDASRSNKTAEVGAMRKMLDRTEERFGVTPDRIAADTAYATEADGWVR